MMIGIYLILFSKVSVLSFAVKMKIYVVIFLWMSFRAERLLEEYAEAKLAMLSSVMTSDATADEDDDDDDDDDRSSGRDTTRRHRSSTVNSHGHNGHHLSTTADSKAGRKSRVAPGNSGHHRRNRASSSRGASIQQPVQGSAASRDNPTSRRESPASWRENSDATVAGKQSKCSREGRNALGTINHESNLMILGQKALPPVPAKCLYYPRGYLGNWIHFVELNLLQILPIIVCSFTSSSFPSLLWCCCLGDDVNIQPLRSPQCLQFLNVSAALWMSCPIKFKFIFSLN